ncbi:hypothetical protein BDZ89DRAFT_1045920 [Hymenopellis radicata]|nr:hypothetical protein BDZ89DRAFT_1045920 [Hymenopellis radicata]
MLWAKLGHVSVPLFLLTIILLTRIGNSYSLFVTISHTRLTLSSLQNLTINDSGIITRPILAALAHPRRILIKSLQAWRILVNSKCCPTCTLPFPQPDKDPGKTRTARVEELLRQNHAPLDAELSAFRKTAEDARATLDDLDAKILEARELLESLLSARRHMQSHFEDAKSLLHPMRSIPNELLLEIFGRCIPEIFSDADPDALDPKGAPWLLARIIQFSRSLNPYLVTAFLVFGGFRLWLPSDASDLHVDVFQPMRTPVLRGFEMINSESWQALEHDVPFPGSHPTSVTRFPAFDVDALNYLRGMAGLKELDVLASSETHIPIHDVISVPKLRSLTITESNNAAGCSNQFFSALAIPALSELTIVYHAKSVLHFPASPLPLGNLTKLDITCEMNSHVENTQHLLNFLALTHHVECLRLYDLDMTLEFVNGLNLVNTGGSLVRLPYLRFLNIGECARAPLLADDLDPLFEMLFSRLPAAIVAQGKKGGEEKVDAYAQAGMDGTVQSAATNQSGTDFDPRSRLDSKDHRSYKVNAMMKNV